MGPKIDCEEIMIVMFEKRHLHVVERIGELQDSIHF